MRTSCRQTYLTYLKKIGGKRNNLVIENHNSFEKIKIVLLYIYVTPKFKQPLNFEK